MSWIMILGSVVLVSSIFAMVAYRTVSNGKLFLFILFKNQYFEPNSCIHFMFNNFYRVTVQK